MRVKIEADLPQSYVEEILYRGISEQDVKDAVRASIEDALPEFKVKVLEVGAETDEER